MKLELAAYRGKKICVAVSGGRDSMALLHYLDAVKDEYEIILTALNCDHKMRECSAKDSIFVKAWCSERNICLFTFEANVQLKSEAEAREWRRSCYFKAAKTADFIATAHHLNDNAETVLFNLARGSALAGVTGITDTIITNVEGDRLNLIHPLISVTRDEINAYIAERDVPFVDDETNFSDTYTRNYIRNNVLPSLEKAVPDAAKAIYRFSRLAAEDEGFFKAEVTKRSILSFNGNTAFIKYCEKPLFTRAAVIAVKDFFRKKDYTFAQIDILYNLQSAENGKRFEFLGLTAYREECGISIMKTTDNEEGTEVLFSTYLCGNLSIYGGQFLKIAENGSESTASYDRTVLRFDLETVPRNAVIRFMKSGDKFVKFGGGTKSLGDFFTDRKIPVRVRKSIPLIANDSEILAVCGVEISDRIKVTSKTRKVGLIICEIK